MNKKTILKYVKTAGIVLLVVVVFGVLFWGADKLFHFGVGPGQLIAEYDGEPVYEKDVADIINYQIMAAMLETGSGVNLNEAKQNAVKTYVRYKAMELDLKLQGYVVDEAKVQATYDDAMAQIETKMSYKEWRETYNVSKKFLREDVYRHELEQLYREVNQVTVTDAEAREYYAVHALKDYSKPAGYYWTSMIRPVKDITDATEAAAAKAEMDAYLAKLLDGSMTWDAVNKELDGKYNVENGYINAIYEGADKTSNDAMIIFESEQALADHIAKLGEDYPKRDASAKKDSEEYEQYMSYLGKVFQANTLYALQNMEVGEIWEKTLETYVGYYVIRLDSVETVNDFVPFEDVKDEIVSILKTEKEETALSDYYNKLEKEYGILYYFG